MRACRHPEALRERISGQAGWQWLWGGILAIVLLLQIPGVQAKTDISNQRRSVLISIQDDNSLSIEQDTVQSGLEAYNNVSLADRMPLVLIHGIGGNEHALFNWGKLLTFLDGSPEFNRRYKIYLYHYDSSQSVPAISRDLKYTLRGFIGALGGRHIKILAYSEGGLLTRNALQDAYLDTHTTEVLTIATPFHGSPLANPDWLGAQVKTESPLNIVRLSSKLAYGIAGRKYPSFREDFQWDNFDGALPAEASTESRQSTRLNSTDALPPDYALARKAHFITYGGFFGSELSPTLIQRELELTTPPPQQKSKLRLVFKRNVLFSVIRKNIGKLPLASRRLAHFAQPSRTKNSPPAAPEIEPISMMMFNDGISPISSQLWLGRYTQTGVGVTIPVAKLWSTLRTLKGNPNTRLFPGLDHRNWMDGETRTKNPRLPDLLNPDEPPRTVFEWIVHDLMT